MCTGLLPPGANPIAVKILIIIIIINICILTLTFIQGENEIYSCTEVYTGIIFLQDDSEVYAARS